MASAVNRFDPGLRGVLQPRTRGREEQREADVVRELGPGADPPCILRESGLPGTLGGVCASAALRPARFDCTHTRSRRRRGRGRGSTSGADQEAAQAAVLALGSVLVAVTNSCSTGLRSWAWAVVQSRVAERRAPR